MWCGLERVRCVVWFRKGNVWVWLRRKWGGGCDLEEMSVAWKTGV